MTLNERIFLLVEHGDFDPQLVSGILNIPLSEVEAVLTDNRHTAVPPSSLVLRGADTRDHTLAVGADGTLTLDGDPVVPPVGP